MSADGIRRLQKEYLMLENDPVEFVKAVSPLNGNLHDCHFCFQGPTGTPYENGYYHGVLNFPPKYPFRPPDIRMMTPSGRFEINKKLCLSITSYHPETWSAAYSIGAILRAFISFMAENDSKSIGAIEETVEVRKELAAMSLQLCSEDEQFGRLFPEIKKEIDDKLKTTGDVIEK